DPRPFESVASVGYAEPNAPQPVNFAPARPVLAQSCGVVVWNTSSPITPEVPGGLSTVTAAPADSVRKWKEEDMLPPTEAEPAPLLTPPSQLSVPEPVADTLPLAFLSITPDAVRPKQCESVPENV